MVVVVSWNMESWSDLERRNGGRKRESRPCEGEMDCSGGGILVEAVGEVGGRQEREHVSLLPAKRKKRKQRKEKEI